MLEVIQKNTEIRDVQLLLIDELNKSEEIRDLVKVGYQGGNEKLEVSWSTELGIWWGFKKIHNRYWNSFGTKEPEWNSNNSHIITCEINPPFEGIDRRISGVFAKDSEGKYYVLHRGKIGGGRKGIGKSRFQQEFRGEWVTVRDGEGISRLALVAQLENPRFAQQIANFVHEVKRIKRVATGEEEASPMEDTSFSQEFSGTRSYSAENQEIEADCDHGIITNALAEHLKKLGLRVGNNQYVDLYVVDENKDIKISFEVKTSAMTTHYYGAIGQLMFHSARQKKKPKIVAVFPEAIDKKSRRVFEKLDIDCLTYKWVGKNPRFTGLSRMKRY